MSFSSRFKGSHSSAPSSSPSSSVSYSGGSGAGASSIGHSPRDTVMVAGIDVDGQLRGKFVPLSKVRGAPDMPFCSIVFGWDANDDKYDVELSISNADNGYADLRAIPDWSTLVPYPAPMLQASLVLAHFNDANGAPLHSDPRSLLRRVLARGTELGGLVAKAGAEIEFYNFRHGDGPAADAGAAAHGPPISAGMHGYSVLRPSQNATYWADIRAYSRSFGIEFDTFHSETGPGVLEFALAYRDAATIADQVTLFKFAVRAAGLVPCFMAKPQTGMPGNSGHLHCSVVDAHGANVFAAAEAVPNAPFPETEFLSETGRSFLAGLLDGLDDIMLMFAPNVNSYKRLDPKFWAPTTACWGAENRLASIRLIDAYRGSKSCRFEVRIPGADLIPHFALGAIFGLGYRGVAKRLKLTTPPVRSQADIRASHQLPNSLPRAIERFERQGSLARELFGDAFVEHYAATRWHEWTLSQRAVTDWEVARYLETA